MTPLADPQTQPDRRYNVSAIQFGTWSRLFPCLSTSLRTKLQTTLTIIVATAVLYNFMRRRNDPIDEPDHLPPAGEELPAVHGGERRLGNAVRHALIIQHFP